jgi:hypothetical protein
MTGTSRKGNLLATVSVALAIVLTGGPSFSAEPVRDTRPAGVPEGTGADGNVYREGGNGTAVPCGTPADGTAMRSQNAEPSVADTPCSIETLRKRAAKARIS